MNGNRHTTVSTSAVREKGFSLLEIMVAVAIIAILAVVGVGFYEKYVSRAKSADIAVKYDAIRTNLRVNVADGAAADCAVAASKFDTQNLPEKYATLSYSFEAVPGGFRPVLSVCATAGKHNVEGVKAARAAHDLFLDKGIVEKGAVLTDSAVSFALRLTANDNAVCKTYTKPAGGECTGAPVQASAQAPTPAKPASQADCQPHQHFVAGMGCNNVCNPGNYYVEGPPARCSGTPVQAPTAAPTIRNVELRTKITGATALSAFSGAQTGVPIGTQLVGLYLAGSDVNQLASASPTQLPRVTTPYTPVGDAGYQYLDAQSVLVRLMPGMAGNLQARIPPGAQNFWNGGIAVFSDGTVARMQKASNGDTSGSEKDYIYFTVLSGVNAQQGMSIVSGTGAPGQSVQVRNGNTVLATVQADAQGNWNFAGPASLAAAQQSLSAVEKPRN